MASTAAGEGPVEGSGGAETAGDLSPGLQRKLFWGLVLPIGLITFANAIDRMNISFAGHAMSEEIGLTPDAFGYAVSVFFVAYLLFQYPHAALLRRLGIKVWLFGAITLWGISGIWMSQVNSAFEFYAARFLLGMAEAGFAPGMTYFISRWVPKSARATALSGALAAVPLSMVLGGPLCGFLLGVENSWDISSWRWMFLVLALPHFLLAIAAAIYFVDSPGSARWLKPEERVELVERMAQEEGTGPGELSDSAQSALSGVLRDPWMWRCCIVWLLVMTGAYAMIFWLPQLVRQLAEGHSEFVIGVLSALPQLALMIGLLLNGRHSDRTGERLWHIALAAAVGGVAMLAAAWLPTGWLVLALLTVAGLGIGASQGVFWTLPATAGVGGRVVPVSAIALISMFGTAGGIIGPALAGIVLARTGSFAPTIAVLAVMLLVATAVLLAGRASLQARREAQRAVS